MTWLQLEVTLEAAEIERVEAALLSAGALSVSCSDAGAQPLYEPDPQHPPLWHDTQLTAMFPETTDPDGLRAVLQAALHPLRLPSHRFLRLEDREWEREWLKDFKPMRFGRRLWIVPSAYAPPDPDAINIRLDPGLAFGTGTHATTALCLEWLETADLTGKTVMDYGCGSGILAIAAARLGASCVWAMDNDPQALTATHANAGRNQVSDIVKIHASDDKLTVQADLLLANILAGPLVELAPRFAALLKPGGSLVLSGILKDQRDAIQGAYASQFRFTGEAQCQEWLRLDGLRRPESF